MHIKPDTPKAQAVILLSNEYPGPADIPSQQSLCSMTWLG